jgi:hypothetical protein
VQVSYLVRDIPGETHMNPTDAVLDALATELPAAATVFRYAALLPAAHVPLPWLQELAKAEKAQWAYDD